MAISWEAHPSTLSVGSIREVHVDLSSELANSELLLGTPAVTEVDGSLLTITDVRVSTGEETFDGVSVAAGKAVLFTVAGSTVGTHVVLVSVETSARPTAQRLVVQCELVFV